MGLAFLLFLMFKPTQTNAESLSVNERRGRRRLMKIMGKFPSSGFFIIPREGSLKKIRKK